MDHVQPVPVPSVLKPQENWQSGIRLSMTICGLVTQSHTATRQPQRRLNVTDRMQQISGLEKREQIQGRPYNC